MTKLHLGVIDIPYVDLSPPTKKGKPRKRTAGTVTTGDVAGWLEDEYGIMQHFIDLHGPDIGDALAKSIDGAMESLLMGAPLGHEVFGTATAEIEQMFHTMLATRELEGLGIAGVPTQAALDGKSSRKKKKNSGGRRPSFIDSGLYDSSFKAWVD